MIDDSITVRTITAMGVQQAGYHCLGFADGVSALRWLQQEALDVPRLLVLDLGLPGLDGYQIARLIRRNPHWNEMLIVLLTARDRVTDRVKGYLAGAQVYLTKLFRIEQLVSVLQAMLPHEAQPAKHPVSVPESVLRGNPMSEAPRMLFLGGVS